MRKHLFLGLIIISTLFIASCFYTAEVCGDGICGIKERTDPVCVEDCVKAPQTPTCVDHIKNGDETDVDCGSNCPDCVAGKYCEVGGDCEPGLNCTDGVCTQ